MGWRYDYAVSGEILEVRNPGGGLAKNLNIS